MALTADHFKRIRAAEAELKAANAAAAAEMEDRTAVVVDEGPAGRSTWVRVGNRFVEVKPLPEVKL